MIKYEFIIFLGLGLALGIAELVSVRRAIRRAREEDAAKQQPPPPIQPDANPQGR